MTSTQDETREQVREQVRARYAAAAVAVTTGGTGASCGCGCGDGESGSGGHAAGCCAADASAPAAGCCGSQTGSATAEALDQDGAVFGAALYGDATGTDADGAGSGGLAGLPAEAVQASLGCGNPLAVADLHPGERVLDLGSGGGIDVLLSARRVGPTGFAYGVDMTDEMLDLARANAARAGAGNVEFIRGTIEDIPLPDAAVDVVISNCVINLSVDKPAVIAQMFRVLRPGGRVGVSDVVAEDHIPAAERAARGTYAGCIAGALSRSEYLELLTAAGFVDATVEFTHEAVPGMHAAIVRATKPATDSTPADAATQGAIGGAEAGGAEAGGAEAGRAEAGGAAGGSACCSTGTHAACCDPSAKAGCCGQEPAQAATDGPPAACGCR